MYCCQPLPSAAGGRGGGGGMAGNFVSAFQRSVPTNSPCSSTLAKGGGAAVGEGGRRQKKAFSGTRCVGVPAQRAHELALLHYEIREGLKGRGSMQGDLEDNSRSGPMLLKSALEQCS